MKRRQLFRDVFPSMILTHIMTYLDEDMKLDSQVISRSARHFFVSHTEWTFEARDPVSEKRARRLGKFLSSRKAHTELSIEPQNDITHETWRLFINLPNITMRLRNVTSSCLRVLASEKINEKQRTNNILSLNVRNATPHICDIITRNFSNIRELGLVNINNINALNGILQCCDSERLVRLDLSSSRQGGKLLTRDVISHLVNACPNLKSLSLCRRVEVNDSSIEVLCMLKYLTHLNLSYSSVTGNGLRKIVSRCSDLISLIASRCPSPNNLTVEENVVETSKLKVFNLSFSFRIVVSTLYSIAKSFTSLLELNVSYLHYHDDDDSSDETIQNGIVALSTSCQKLVRLYLDGNRIRASTLAKIGRTCSRDLRFVGLESTGLSNKAIDRFRRKSCPQCVVRNNIGHTIRPFSRFWRR